MSGICGIVFSDIYQSAPVLNPMLEALVHRGGSERSEYSYKNVCIGCCGSRLASNSKKTRWCLLDGELFQTDSLRKKMEAAGRSLPQTADAEEFILTAFDLWKEDFLNEIEGNFALAILDQESEEIILARDRVGRKPLYWYHHKKKFIFASELKAMMNSGLIPQNPSENALASYLFFGFVPQDMTSISGVIRLLPNHYLRLRLNHIKSIQPYWSYSSYFNKSSKKIGDNPEKKLKKLILESFSDRLPSKGEKCSCLLSGGLGSTSVAYYLKMLSHPFKAFSCAFKNQTESDLNTTRAISKVLHIPHSTSTVDPNTLLENLPKIIWHLDEPIADPNIVITWELAQAASQYGPYTFSGMGVDEIFGAHNRFSDTETHLSTFKTIKHFLKPIFKMLFLKPLFYIWPQKGWHFLREYRINPSQIDYLNKNALFDIASGKKAAPAIAHLFNLENFLHRFYNISRVGTNMDSMLYLDVKTRLVDHYIFQYDRLTACHHLKWETPYLSRDILEFVALMPKGGFRTDIDESLLASILRDFFSEEIVNRKKITRYNLLYTWVDHPKMNEAFSLLQKGSLVQSGFLNVDWIPYVINSKLPNRFLLLWSILCLEIWYRLYIDQPIRNKPPDIDTLNFLRMT